MNRYRLRTLAGCAAALCFAAMGLSLAAASGEYHLLKTYSFGAAPGSTMEYFDYVTVDPQARRVYLSRGTAVQVIDADTGASLGFIPGFKRQHGVALVPEFNRGFVTDGGAAKISIFDLKTLKTVGEAKSDPDTDCIVYDPASKDVFSMNGDSHDSTVVNARTGEVVKTISWEGLPSSPCRTGAAGFMRTWPTRT